MIKEVIASLKTWMKGGFTLVEVMVVLVILTTILALATPMTVGFVETAERKRSVAEAEMVCTAVGVYLAEESLKGPISAIDLYEKLLLNPLGSQRNPITDGVEGYSKGARLVSIQYNTRTSSFNGIVYIVNGYRISVYPADGEATVIKIK